MDVEAVIYSAGDNAMKPLIISSLFLAMCIFVSATQAHAQAYSCHRPPELRVPSGHTITERDRENLVREAASYLADMRGYAECLRMEHEHAMDELDDVANSLDRLDREFSDR